MGNNWFSSSSSSTKSIAISRHSNRNSILTNSISIAPETRSCSSGISHPWGDSIQSTAGSGISVVPEHCALKFHISSIKFFRISNIRQIIVDGYIREQQKYGYIAEEEDEDSQLNIFSSHSLNNSNVTNYHKNKRSQNAPFPTSDKKSTNYTHIPYVVRYICAVYLGYADISSNILDIDEQKEILLEILSHSLPCNISIITNIRKIFTASSYNFQAYKFHKICDNRRNIFILIQSIDNHIFGGFTATGFSSAHDSNGWNTDSNAFLFLLDIQSKRFQKKRYQERTKFFYNGTKKLYLPIIYKLCKQAKYALKTDCYLGPTFGSGYDLVLCDGCDKIKDSYVKEGVSYNISNGYVLSGSHENCNSATQYKFMVKEYEVFQIEERLFRF